MSDNTLKVLEDAGVSVDRISPEERTVLEGLSSEELDILASVHKKLEAVSEVEGQTAVIGGILF